jgi:hypothetical protein
MTNVLNKPYTTHIPMLIKCVQATDGGVLELGAGLSSTPLLHWLCQEKARPLITFEENKMFYDYARKFQSRNHRIRLTDWNNFKVGHWSVALVDQATKSRAKTIAYLKDKVDYIVVHDTHAEEHYGYDKVWPLFKYRYAWKGCNPWTSVVSNKFPLEWLS